MLVVLDYVPLWIMAVEHVYTYVSTKYPKLSLFFSFNS